MKATITQLAAYVGKSERTVHRYLASGKWPHTNLPGGLIEIDDSLVLAPENGQEGVLLATLQRIEQKLNALSARVDTLAASRPQVTRHAQQSANLPSAQSDLPPNLTPWRDYAREKGLSETTVQRYIDAGEIPVVSGRWARGHAIIKTALDEEGRAAIDRLFGK